MERVKTVLVKKENPPSIWEIRVKYYQSMDGRGMFGMTWARFS